MSANNNNTTAPSIDGDNNEKINKTDSDISVIDLKLDDEREFPGHPIYNGDQSGIQVNATLGLKGQIYEEVLFQNNGDGVLELGPLDVGANQEFFNALELEDEAYSILADRLKEAGVTDITQAKYDEYVNSLEPQIEDVVFKANGAIGGVEFRAASTKDGEIVIQSMDNAKGDRWETAGTISRKQWDEFEFDCDSNDPAPISSLCEELRESALDTIDREPDRADER